MSTVIHVYVKQILRSSFIFTFLVTTFIEVFFGLPSFIFLLIPLLITGLTKMEFKLVTASVFLSVIFMSAIGGFISFIINLVNNKNINKHRIEQQSRSWYQFKTYDNFNCIVLFCLSFGAILHAFANFAPYVTVVSWLYYEQMADYHDFNPRCPNQLTTTRSNNDIFLDELHGHYLCCGWNGPKDWINQLKPSTRIPFSCCIKQFDPNCSLTSFCSIIHHYHHRQGCKKAMVETFYKYDPFSYGTGLFYYILKMIAYLSYCMVIKEHIDVF